MVPSYQCDLSNISTYLGIFLLLKFQWHTLRSYKFSTIIFILTLALRPPDTSYSLEQTIFSSRNRSNDFRQGRWGGGGGGHEALESLPITRFLLQRKPYNFWTIGWLLSMVDPDRRLWPGLVFIKERPAGPARKSARKGGREACGSVESILIPKKKGGPWLYSLSRSRPKHREVVAWMRLQG